MRQNSAGSDLAEDPETAELLKLLCSHERSLFSYVHALVPNWGDAEEIMQQVRIRIWQEFHRYDPAKPFGSWARAIAYYLVLTHRRQTNRKREFFSEHILQSVSDTYESHVANSSNERHAALLRCLEKLSDQKRQIVEKYYLGPVPVCELAESMSLTPNALRQSLFRIRKALFECIERSLRQELQG